jgi:hypothetical protein
MSLPIERWARQAAQLERQPVEGELGGYSWPGREDAAFGAGMPDRFRPVASTRVLSDVNDLMLMHKKTWQERERIKQDLISAMVQQRGQWRQRMSDVRASGTPVAGEGTYGVLMGYPLPAVLATTSVSGTANLWPAAVYTPIPANGVLAPQAYRVTIAAKITTSTSPANIGFDPRIGTTTWTTGGTALTGTAIGASTNVALTASITAAFYYIYGDLTIRSVGNPGNNTTAVGMFHYVSTQATASGLAGPAVVGAGHNLLFGGTSASYDGTVAQGFSLGAVHTVTTITHNLDQLHGMDWN